MNEYYNNLPWALVELHLSCEALVSPGGPCCPATLRPAGPCRGAQSAWCSGVRVSSSPGAAEEDALTGGRCSSCSSAAAGAAVTGSHGLPVPTPSPPWAGDKKSEVEIHLPPRRPDPDFTSVLQLWRTHECGRWTRSRTIIFIFAEEGVKLSELPAHPVFLSSSDARVSFLYQR